MRQSKTNFDPLNQDDHGKQMEDVFARELRTVLEVIVQVTEPEQWGVVVSDELGAAVIYDNRLTANRSNLTSIGGKFGSVRKDEAISRDGATTVGCLIYPSQTGLSELAQSLQEECEKLGEENS